jgi:hypothetical protein
MNMCPPVGEEPVLRKKLRRTEMVVFFEKLPPTVARLDAERSLYGWEGQARGHHPRRG